MVKNTYIRTVLLLHRKLTAFHSETNIEVVCEVKIWQLPESDKYPFGLRYSLFCVDVVSKKVLIGYDNHYPKGPHIHVGNSEMIYVFSGYEKLLDDFWSEVIKRGFAL